MNVIEIIEKKRFGQKLTFDEIEYMMNNYISDKITDYQMSAFLMAICCNGMDDEETYFLTKIMVESGDVIDLSNIKKIKVDKHSTGGVGDKTSLVLAPLLSVFDVSVCKMSGRGLGFTGGTLDKLESLKSFNINLDENEFINQINDIGLAIIGQTQDLVPADKKIYALRDVTGTVNSISLIAASIMSKKIASGADYILIDLKCGSGAFMKDEQSAELLAEKLIAIGNKYNRVVKVMITSMDQPLGKNIGNSLEVIEAKETLLGKGDEDFKNLCVNCAYELLKSCGKNVSKEEILEVLENKKAYYQFIKMLEAQNSNEDELTQLTLAKNIYEYKINTAGYLEKFDTAKIGLAAMELGAGRKEKTDKIKYDVGIIVNKKIGDKIEKGDILYKIYYDQEYELKQAKKLLDDSYKISLNKINKNKLIKKIIE